MTVSVWMRPGRNGGQYQDIIVNRSDSLYNWYISENKLDTIKDKDWEVYNWFWLLNIKSLFEFIKYQEESGR
jgi:hypothetical protein